MHKYTLILYFFLEKCNCLEHIHLKYMKLMNLLSIKFKELKKI